MKKAGGGEERSVAPARRGWNATGGRLVQEGPETALDRGWQLIESGEADAAAALLRSALERRPDPPDEADLRHLLGQALDELGDEEGMIREWLLVRRLDEGLDPPRPLLSPDQFERVAAQALDELPADLLERLRDVPIVIDDRPSIGMVSDGIDPRLLGLFHGVPYPDQSTMFGTAAPWTIYLFQRNLESEVSGPDELAAEIRVTVIHETAHFFGLSDADLARLGLD
jgi:predicted Zn-dependent protease with MMP-like domain